MSDRYSRIFMLAPRLYTEGAPVVIFAGALLKDTFTGNILAQLKIQNIQWQPLKAVTVLITQYDVEHKMLEDQVEYRYILDERCSQGIDFGQETPILLDSNTRSFEVCVIKVVFANNDVWEAEPRLWTSLIVQKDISYSLKRNEFREQWLSMFGDNCRLTIEDDRDLWLCSCGGINKKESNSCYKCRHLYETYKNTTDKELESRYNEWLESEKIKQNEARKKEKKIIIAVVIVIVTLIELILMSSLLEVIREDKIEERLMGKRFSHTTYHWYGGEDTSSIVFRDNGELFYVRTETKSWNVEIKEGKIVLEIIGEEDLEIEVDEKDNPIAIIDSDGNRFD